MVLDNLKDVKKVVKDLNDAGLIPELNGNDIINKLDEVISKIEYNGWCNYETWCAHLHLTNTEWMYRYCLDSAKDFCKEVEWVEYENRDGSKILLGARDPKNLLADKIKDFFFDDPKTTSEMNYYREITSMLTDLTTSAIGRIDFNAIAEDFLEDMEEYKQYKDTLKEKYDARKKELEGAK